MLIKELRRCFHSSSTILTQVEKSQLAKLRKKTGYTISNCKKALEIHQNNFQKALEWLNDQAQKEGWTKAEQLHGRNTVQGLVGIHLESKGVTMVEVNCETDFVSRNREFRNLVSAVTSTCHQYAKRLLPLSDPLSKIHFDSKQLTSLPWEEQSGKLLSDLVAIKIGRLGENMAVRRAVCLRVPDDSNVGCYVHPIADSQDRMDNFFFGKYGAIVALKKLIPNPEVHTPLTVEQCGRQLAQHIIGMNPQEIGEIDEQQNTDPVSSGSSNENADEVEETRMIHQEFLTDPSITVGDFLQQYGIKMLDFARYECGQVQEDHQG